MNDSEVRTELVRLGWTVEQANLIISHWYLVEGICEGYSKLLTLEV